VAAWVALLEGHPVTGGDVFDLQLAATMQAHNVQRTYTFNTGDFEKFSELTVIVPPRMLISSAASEPQSWHVLLESCSSSFVVPTHFPDLQKP